MVTSSTVGGSGRGLLHVWCAAASNQQRLIPHLLHQHIADRLQHFRSCWNALPPEVTSSPWAPESAPEVQRRRPRTEELSDAGLDDEEEDATDTEAGQGLLSITKR